MPIVQHALSLADIEARLKAEDIYLRASDLAGRPTLIGYEKLFRWSWLATQLNTIIVATDYGDEQVTRATMEHHMGAAFTLAGQEYTGWPRGLQGGMAVISIVRSSHIDDAAKDYCLTLASGKHFAGFSIPVVIDSAQGQTVSFEKDALWGKIYYPHFRKLIARLLA